MSVAPGWALDVVSYLDWAAGGALIQNHGRQLGRDMELQTEYIQQKGKKDDARYTCFSRLQLHMGREWQPQG